jgi:hypothetical protein
MLELSTTDLQVLNTKDRITIDLLKDGLEFLKSFEIDTNYLLDTVSLVYKYLETQKKIPHNLYKFLIAAYYIISRHPFAFPVHESKKKFCNKFGLEISSLEYSVEKISSALCYYKLFDDMNYPYYIDPKRDLSMNFIKKIVKKKVNKTMMRFLLYNKSINSQILTEELVCEIVFEYKAFPEEFFRQLYEIINDLVEIEFKDYNEYVRLQKKCFI